MLTSREGSQGRRGKWIVAAIAFAIPWCLLAARNLQISPEGERRLADTDPTRRLSAWQQSAVPQPESLLVAWEGSTCDDPRIARFTEALTGHDDTDGIRRGGAPEIAAVTTAADMLGRLTEQGIDTGTAVQRLTGTFIGAGGLKLQLTDAGRSNCDATVARLVRAVRESLAIELQTRGPVEAWSGDDHAGDAAASEIEISVPEHDVQLFWSGFHPLSTTFAQVRALALGLTDFPTSDEPRGRKLVQECFLAPGSPVGIQVDLSAAGVADVPAALRAIDRAAAAAGIENIHVVGEPIARQAEARAVANAVWNSAAPALRLSQRSLPLLLALAAACLTCLVVRSLRMGMLLFGLTAVTVLLSFALLRLTGANIDPVLLAVPIYAGSLMLASGLQVSVHRFGHDIEDDAFARNRANRRTATIIAAMVILPLGISSTPVVRQLGLLGATSALIVLLLDALATPALQRLAGTARTWQRDNNGPWLAIADSIARRPGLASLLSCVLLIAGAAGLARLQIQSGEVYLRPADSKLAADTRFIEDNLTGATPLDVIVRFSGDSLSRLRFVERAEVVRAAELAVLGHPAVTGTSSLADLMPVTELPAADAPTRQRVLFNRRSNEVEELVRSGQIAGADTLLSTADRAADWQIVGDERLSRIGDELWRIGTRAVLPPGADVQEVSHEINASIQEILRKHPGADHVIAGPSVTATATRVVMLRSLSKTLLLASVMLLGVLIWTLRSPTGILIGLVANVLPIACALGVFSLRGVRIDVEAMVAALLALGLSAQSGTRFLISFREGIQAGETHVAAMRRALFECGAGDWRFAVVSIGVALALSTSPIGALSNFGKLLAGMIGATQLTATILLPALLAGRVGRWLARALRVPEPVAAATAQDAIQSPHVRFEPAARDVVRPTV